MTIIAFDADTLLFKYSKALEEDYIIAEHKNSCRQREFKNITEFAGKSKKTVGGWLAEENERRGTDFRRDDFIVTKHARLVENYSECLESQKAGMERYVSELLNKPWGDYFPDMPRRVNLCLKICLGGDGNYRKAIMASYKSGRVDKPAAFLNLQRWFLSHYTDEVVSIDGIEADDVVSILGWWGWENDKDVVLVHIDKDLDQVPGRHYNPDKGKHYEISEDEAFRNLMVQVLSGDSTDGIPGIVGVGKVTARNHIDGCGTKSGVVEKVMCEYKKAGHEIDYLVQQHQMVGLMKKKGAIPHWWEVCREVGIDDVNKIYKEM